MPVLTFAGSPGAYQSFLLPVALVGFISQYWAFRHFREWFDKYNYVLAVALDSGMAIATVHSPNSAHYYRLCCIHPRFRGQSANHSPFTI
jgi:OPT oligopeptide transporter protein